MMSLLKPKGSRNKTFTEFPERFMSAQVDPGERNRTRHKGSVEDCASENRHELTRRWYAQMGSDNFANTQCGVSVNFIAISFTGIIEFIDCIVYFNIRFEEY